NGPDGFATEATLPVGSFVRDIDTGDFNGDGVTDIAALRSANGSDINVRLFLSDPAFGFGVRDVAVPRNPLQDTSELAVQDANGDGRLDLLLTGRDDADPANTGTVQQFLQNPDGTFTQTATGLFSTTSIRQLDAVDLNGDGDRDLLVTSANSSAFVSFTGVSGVEFLGEQLGRLFPADLNGDGLLDLVGTGRPGLPDSVFTFLQTPGNTFAAGAERGIGFNATFVTGIDVDGDNVDELAVRNQFESGLFAVGLAGDLTETQSLDLQQSETGFVALDLENDGDTDLVFPRPRVRSDALNTGEYVVLENTGDAIQNLGRVTLGDNVNHVISGDFNNDGQDDILASVEDTGLVLLLGNGDDYFGQIIAGGSGSWGDSIAVDLNNDGRLDAAAFNSGNQLVVVLQNANGTFGAPQTLVLPSFGSGLDAADFTGDGLADLVVSTQTDATVRVLPNNGSGVFGIATTALTGIAANSIAAGDLDGDNNLDLVLTSGRFAVGDGLLYLATGNGDGTFNVDDSIAISDNFGNVTLTDLNDDDIAEIVLIDARNRSLRLLPGSPSRVYDTMISSNTGFSP
ncbi:MAG: VCBS repeat-containing protein, partial [Planctomycetota bacterium]